jgi:glycerol-3-phosphate dehydrogenase
MANRNTVSRSTKLGLEERSAAIEALKTKELDVLVVGGGIVGAGSALDSVTRGLSTGILEARDWSSGTSSRSSKLVHGGIRYLEQLDFRLVREALIERGLLLQRIAPHLVKPVKFPTRSTAPSSNGSTSAQACCCTTCSATPAAVHLGCPTTGT